MIPCVTYILYTGGRTRRLRLEAGSRRSVPLSPLANSSVCARWQRSPAGHNDWDHFRFMAPLIPVNSVADVRWIAVFALAGFLSPSNRGSLATVMLIFWTFSGRHVTRSPRFQSY